MTKISQDYARRFGELDATVVAGTVSMKDYQSAWLSLRDEFSSSLAEEYLDTKDYAPGSAAQLVEAVFGMAWEQGHLIGMAEVEECYHQIADVVNIATRGARGA